MSVHGEALIAAGSSVSRISTWAIASGSPPGCQGRPRWKLPAGASLTIFDRVIRNPYRLPFQVEAAVM